MSIGGGGEGCGDLVVVFFWTGWMLDGKGGGGSAARRVLWVPGEVAGMWWRRSGNERGMGVEVSEVEGRRVEE